MVKFMAYFNPIYFLIAVGVSIFYGIYGEKIFLREKQYKDLTGCKKIRKFIIHFSGSAAGFLVLYYLMQKAMFCMYIGKFDMNLTDILLLVIALMGISGFFPEVADKLRKGAVYIIEKFIEKRS